MSKTIFGDYNENVPAGLNGFRMDLNTKNINLRWSQCNLLADFLADYYSCFFPVEGENNDLIDRGDMSHSINYVINEMVENAVKFHSGGDIAVATGIVGDEIIFLVSNQFASGSTGKFQQFLVEITSGDPGVLFIQRIEQNAVDGGKRASGLGFLTMMNDYKVKVGWKFEDCVGDQNNVLVRTMARLKTRKDS